ncbi:glycine cleavage system aminomethyltransferase GcvT [Roseisolibacter agri]|uniref:Aminomethyltransferase n=1 Tax=Roseisolibacter agri TaxID=2014610 RepID=A0AA37Q7D4_9BACT|nr:glycine cleavage system aminomethyltransferase GcvT [Roseisolibacter agri]GLC27920.1 aminomethyltransferase [Roseisolibacter agri]
MADVVAEQALKRTPLHEQHRALGAKIVPFAGYEMPVQYPGGITAEHKAVREGCGVFDVSHMGEFIVTGPDAVAFVNHVTTNDVAKLAVGQVHYSTILNERGTIEDDCLVYRMADRLMLVVNASNREKDLAHILRYKGDFDVTVEDRSDDYALLAVQGPKAEEILQPLTATDLSQIAYYWFAEGEVAGVSGIISRTGYTGEDGFELYVPAADAPRLWDALLATGRITPAGLGARDTLRLEMGMALYGNDIDDTVTPLEANLGWLVKLAKGDFVGKAALEAEKAAGIPRRLVGFTVAERAIPRHGYPVFHDGQPSGAVRSGTMSPTLGTSIGTAYLPAAAATPGTTFEIDVRGKRVAATVVKPPFYKDASHK